MKKLYILFLITTLPLIGFGQVIKDYNFNTDNNLEGWTSAGLEFSTTTPNPTGGFLVCTDDGVGGYPAIRSEVFSPLLAVGTTQKIIVTIVAENATTALTWQISNLDTGSTNFGGGALSADFDIPIVAPSAGTSSFEVELPINPDNIDGGISQIAIRAKVPSTTGVTGTIKFDQISIKLINVVTENSWVTNPDFEAGLSPWTAVGGETTASIVAGNGSTSAGQLTFDVDQTTNQLLSNVVYDFGTTVNPSEINVTFDMKSNNTGMQVQILYDIYDASDVKISGNNTALETVVVADTWETFSLNKGITEPFNKIVFSFKVKYVASIVVAGNTVAFDNVNASFSYTTLGLDKIDYKDDVSISLYPNPVQNTLSINAPNAVSKIEVFNILGQKMLSKENSSSIDVSNLNKGVYISKIYQDNNTVSTKRFFKE